MNHSLCDLCGEPASGSSLHIQLKPRPPGNTSGGEIDVYAHFNIAPVGGVLPMDMCDECQRVVRAELTAAMRGRLRAS